MRQIIWQGGQKEFCNTWWFLLTFWIIALVLLSISSCGFYTMARQYKKYPLCANEQTQGDFIKCVNEKYPGDISENWGLKIWDWKEAEEKK